MFFDDTFIGYKARTHYFLLTVDKLANTSQFIKNTTIKISDDELKNYVYKPLTYKYAHIAVIKEEIVGIILFTDLESEILINHLYVTPCQRFKGIGSTLIKKAETTLPDRAIEYIDTSNNYMPWMDCVASPKKIKMMWYLGSFYNVIQSKQDLQKESLNFRSILWPSND